MRRLAIVMASAFGGALLVPATPLAAEEPAPSALLEASANPVLAGSPVRLDSSRSSGTIVGHQWDLDGDGSFETDTGSLPVTEATPADPGTLTVHLRVVDEAGKTGEASLDLTVQAPPQPEPPAAPAEPAAPADPAAPAEEPAPAAKSGDEQAPAEAAPEPAAASTTTTTATPAPPAEPAAATPRQTRTTAAAHKRKASPKVHAAGATSVPIKDFAFKPASVTVSVGDTVTWTNQDQAPHTATANDGSFDTGNLDKGQSGSHTFSKAGTFAYICSVHPSMKGTVVVTGASSGGSNGDDTNDATPTSPSSSGTAGDTPSSGGLPQTGLNLLPVVLIAILLMGSGTLLRRRVGAS